MLSMAVKSYKAGGVLRANKKVPNPTPVQDAYEDIKIYGGTVDSQKALLQCVKYTRVRRIFTLYCLKMERQPVRYLKIFNSESSVAISLVYEKVEIRRCLRVHIMCSILSKKLVLAK